MQHRLRRGVAAAQRAPATSALILRLTLLVIVIFLFLFLVLLLVFDSRDRRRPSLPLIGMSAKRAGVVGPVSWPCRCDAAVHRARVELVRAVREAAAAGMTQAQIAAEIGRSQPEVSRLLRFHGATPLARRLRASRAEVLRAVAEAGGRDVRVFGSVARGEDDERSDVDLLFVMGRPLSLMELGRLEDDVSAAIGVPVDLVPEGSLRPALRDRALTEAVPL
ncbi:MAG: nucleotidyltransferase domain-containing protein [Nostocoides sp.]|uniref:nucleotidyltransferase family protein n=1 Tax=Nostocoides sp. TaxID=1917966 RepID=UPI003C731703